jgi:hypothetical protein
VFTRGKCILTLGYPNAKCSPLVVWYLFVCVIGCIVADGKSQWQCNAWYYEFRRPKRQKRSWQIELIV